MHIYGKSSAFLKFLLIVLLCLSIGIIADLGAATEDLDVITIDNKGYTEDRKSPVLFEHEMHARDYEVNCWECHHDYKEGENVWVPWGTTKKCIDCHDPQKAQGDILRLQTAYHVNCKNCHKERQIFGKSDLAYRECNTCHISE